MSVTTEEPLPLSTTQATGPAPSASPAAEPSRPPPPEVERESGMGQEVDRDTKLEIQKKWEEEMQRPKEQDGVSEKGEWEEKSKATVAPRLTEVPMVAMDSTTILDEITVAPSDWEEPSNSEKDDLFITTEMTIMEPSSTTQMTDEITTIEVLPTTVASTTAKTTRPVPTTPSTSPPRPRQPQTTPSRATPTESSTHSVMSSTVQVRC